MFPNYKTSRKKQTGQLKLLLNMTKFNLFVNRENKHWRPEKLAPYFMEFLKAECGGWMWERESCVAGL